MKRNCILFLILVSVVFTGCKTEDDKGNNLEPIVKSTTQKNETSLEEASTDVSVLEVSEKSENITEQTKDENLENSITDEVIVALDIDLIIEETKEAMGAYSSIYPENSVALTQEQKKEFTDTFASQGLSLASGEFNMTNSDTMLESINRYIDGDEVSFGIYGTLYDGSITRNCFAVYKGEKIYFRVTGYISVEGEIEIQTDDRYENIEYMELTPKGYMIYGLASGVKSGARVAHLDTENRELARLYVEPLGYQGHGALIQNWSESDFSDLSFTDLFSTLYFMKYQQDPMIAFASEGASSDFYKASIPSEIYESTITDYFRVSIEDLKEASLYSEKRDTYIWLPHSRIEGLPTPEVVNYTENEDGSITLVVDAVMLEIGQDKVFTSTLNIIPKDSGCYYISNHIDINESSNIALFVFEKGA